MQVQFKILRYNPEREKRPYYQLFTVDGVHPLDRVLDILHRIKEEQDGTLTFRRSCAHGMCGSDAMKINGKNSLACTVLLKDLNLNKPVVVEPLPFFPIIKDLVVDMEPFFRKYEAVMPYLLPKEPPPDDGREYRVMPEQMERIMEATKCILCGCCSASCPSLWSHPDYLAPAALLKAYRFVFDPRDGAAEERLAIVGTENGLWRCHTIFNCVEACPKDINVTWHISQLKKALLE
ncbi:MAG: succinate dehydrogenase iron-sulfur subunit [Candidatus Kapabacteria bacterium]|nr:succinate dehydrogenase iron-sulfur subunit [Candidatus Kapabacteria bacterium]MDW8225484.1 succinate dehydrogenase iron-sulfur subunit [Bacteroidota bacterium]